MLKGGKREPSHMFFWLHYTTLYEIFTCMYILQTVCPMLGHKDTGVETIPAAQLLKNANIAF